MKSTDKRNIYFLYGIIPGIVIGIGLSFLIFDMSFSEDKIIDKQTQQSQIIKDIDKDKQATSKEKISKKKSAKYPLRGTKKEEQIIDSSIIISTDSLDSLNILAIDSISDSIKHEPLPLDTAKIAGNIQLITFSTDTNADEAYIQDNHRHAHFDIHTLLIILHAGYDLTQGCLAN